MMAAYPSRHKHARKGRHAACKKCDGVVQDSAHRRLQRLRNHGGDVTQPRAHAPCLTCKACETALGCQLASCYEAIRSKEGSQFATYDDGGRGGQKDGPTLSPACLCLCCRSRKSNSITTFIVFVTGKFDSIGNFRRVMGKPE